MKKTFLLAISLLALSMSVTQATSNYHYGSYEYVTIAKGVSPDGKHAITAHGGGPYGYEHFHIYLTDAITGKKIGPLEEIVETLDTRAEAFCAYWTPDSGLVAITYRISRHEPLKTVTYRVASRRAYLISGPENATDEQVRFWQIQCSAPQPSERVFGTRKAAENF